MISLGTTLRSNIPPRHIWVVLSDPQRTFGTILVVNMTTLAENCVDDLCAIGPEDYSLLDHATTIAYSRHRAGPAAGLEAAVQRGDFSIITPVPQATLRRILAGASNSLQIPTAKKYLLG